MKAASEQSLGQMDVHIDQNTGSQFPLGWLTSNGAIWFQGPGGRPPVRVDAGVLLARRPGHEVLQPVRQWLRLAGDHAVLGYTPGDTTKTTVLHLPTGTETTFPISIGPSSPGTPVPDLDFALAPNGDLAGVVPSRPAGFSSCPAFRLSSGSLKPVADSGCGQFPIFDGINLVYNAKAASGCRTTLVDPAGNIVVLAEQNQCLPGFTRGYHANWSNGSYAASGGWTAFLKPNAQKVQQVWVLSPQRVPSPIRIARRVELDRGDQPRRRSDVQERRPTLPRLDQRPTGPRLVRVGIPHLALRALEHRHWKHRVSNVGHRRRCRLRVCAGRRPRRWPRRVQHARRGPTRVRGTTARRPPTPPPKMRGGGGAGATRRRRQFGRGRSHRRRRCKRGERTDRG